LELVFIRNEAHEKGLADTRRATPSAFHTENAPGARENNTY